MMKRETIHAAVAAAALGVAGVVGPTRSEPARPADKEATKPQQQQQAPKKAAGAQRRMQEPIAFMLVVPVPVSRPVVTLPYGTLAPDIEDIRDTIASATEAALTPDGFDDLVERFVDADRNRMGKSGVVDKDLDTLDTVVNQVRQAWRSKYGHDFDIDDEEAVFGPFPVVQGEIGNAPRLAASTIGPADRLAGNDAGDVNLEPGRDVALVTAPPAAGLPEVSVLMIHELPDNWKIDVPDTVSARDIESRLLDHLAKFAKTSDKWPANEAEAYRQISHRVLSAVMGEAPKAQQQQHQQPSK